MLSLGVHVEMASEMLSHSTMAITLDRYSHVTANMQRQPADAIDAALRIRVREGATNGIQRLRLRCAATGGRSPELECDPLYLCVGLPWR
jgi:hypothetical protein